LTQQANRITNCFHVYYVNIHRMEKMFQLKFVDLNEIHVFVMYSFTVLRTVFFKFGKISFDLCWFHVSSKLIPSSTTSIIKCNRNSTTNYGGERYGQTDGRKSSNSPLCIHFMHFVQKDKKN
jgi:hypothetical protein